MTAYSAPTPRHAVCHQRTGRPGRSRCAARHSPSRRLARNWLEAVLERSRQTGTGVAGSAQQTPVTFRGSALALRSVSPPMALPGLSKIRRWRLERHRLRSHGSRRPRSAGATQHRDPGDVEFGQHVLRAVPDAQWRRDRGDQPRRLRGTKGVISAEDGQRRMDRHHESDGIAGRFRSVGGARPRRA
jgi:hypothetical protein